MQVLQEQKPATHLAYIRVGKFRPTSYLPMGARAAG